MATVKSRTTTVEPSPKQKGKPRIKKNTIKLQNGSVAVYASPRISKAMEDITNDLTLFHGVRLLQVLEAVYLQGKKDGARSAFDELEKGFNNARKAVPHKNPGQPKKKK